MFFGVYVVVIALKADPSLSDPLREFM